MDHIITIFPDKIIRRLQGGIGASWHSMMWEVPFNNADYDYPARLINPRGSAIGGNPPVQWKGQWQQLYEHADWLGINWLRVELSHHMYEPRQHVFTWESEEMLALYNILDWCEQHGVDVFLQQMWTEVAWNAYPHVHPLISAPYSLDAYANGIATMLNYLIKHCRYTCIKYFCITNEPPGGTWGYWWCNGSQAPQRLTNAWRKVRKALDKRNIDIPLAGPDWTNLPPLEPSKIDFDGYIGAYDIHTYKGIDANGQQILSEWANWAHYRNKPFFLTEFGNMNLGWGSDNPAPKSFEAAMSNAETILRGLNAGVDAFNRWSFTNRGDMDGQWQLVKTWDRDNKCYLTDIKPEKEAYYGFGIISRFFSKYADILETDKRGSDNQLLSAAIKNNSGDIVMYLVNKSKGSLELSLQLHNYTSKGLYHYQVTKSDVSKDNFTLDGKVLQHNNGRTTTLLLSPESINTITTHYLQHKENGMP